MQDVQKVGVSDMAKALDSMPTYEGWTHNLKSVPIENRQAFELTNRTIASRVLQKVFAARTVVFELFLELCKELDGGLTERHKLMWLMFQLSESLVPGANYRHPFNYVINEGLVGASTDTLSKVIDRRLEGISQKLQTKYIVYVIDEAQQAARRYPSAFMSSDGRTMRSALREITRVAVQGPIKLVLSGTGLSLEEAESVLASGISKPRTQDFQPVHNLGGFDNWTSLEPFMRRYVPDFVLDSRSGQHLQHRIRQYLLGRPANFILLV